MEKGIKIAIVILIIIGAFMLITRGCQRVKQVKIKQTSTDKGTQLAVDIEKKKEE